MKYIIGYYNDGDFRYLARQVDDRHYRVIKVGRENCFFQPGFIYDINFSYLGDIFKVYDNEDEAMVEMI